MNSKDEEHPEGIQTVGDSALLSSYQVMATRRLGYDTLMWQTPMLGLTAQAFLFTSALSPTATRTGRLIAASLALVTSIISMQLMSKHRHHELVDCRLLEDFEKKHGLEPLHVRSVSRDEPAHLNRNWFVGLSSYKVWMMGLALFAAGAAAIIIITLLTPALLT